MLLIANMACSFSRFMATDKDRAAEKVCFHVARWPVVCRCPYAYFLQKPCSFRSLCLPGATSACTPVLCTVCPSDTKVQDGQWLEMIINRHLDHELLQITHAAEDKKAAMRQTLASSMKKALYRALRSDVVQKSNHLEALMKKLMPVTINEVQVEQQAPEQEGVIHACAASTFPAQLLARSACVSHLHCVSSATIHVASM